MTLLRECLPDPCPDRRRFLRLSSQGLLSVGLASLGLGACFEARRIGDRIRLDMQLGWLAGGNQLGEVAAKRLGWFAEEGLDVRVHPGGPNIDGVGIVASGRYLLGEAASSPSVMLAISQGIPIQCFAVGVQRHPYSYFSLPSAPIHRPSDLVGRRVGVQQTGRILLQALLEAHAIDPGELEIVIVGSSLVPLLTGQVDVITGWSTNATALRQLGSDCVVMSLWESGIRLYAMPYYATRATIDEHGEALAAFLRAAGRGWEMTYREPERAVELLVEEYPILRYEDELRAARPHLAHVFTEATQVGGWGTMEPRVWQEQITLYERLGQFRDAVPNLNEVMTMRILEATADSRPHLGPSQERIEA